MISGDCRTACGDALLHAMPASLVGSSKTTYRSQTTYRSEIYEYQACRPAQVVARLTSDGMALASPTIVPGFADQILQQLRKQNAVANAFGQVFNDYQGLLRQCREVQV